MVTSTELFEASFPLGGAPILPGADAGGDSHAGGYRFCLGGEPRVDAVEEDAPARAGALVLLGREAAAALLEPHLGAAVAEVDEVHDHDLARVLLGAVGHGED